MSLSPGKRRLLLVCVGLGAVAGFSWLGRDQLARLAVTKVLQLAGASQIKFQVIDATPWRVELAQVDFQVRTQAFAAGHLVITRAHWWMLSLGRVDITAARVPVNIDGSDENPWAWATYENGTARIAPLALPLEQLAVDGQVLVQAAALPDQAVTVQLRAQRATRTKWSGNVAATGPGLEVKAEGTVDAASKELVFKFPDVALELKPWQNFLSRLVLLPGGAWELAGRVEGRAGGRWRGKEFDATATVRLRDGHFRNLSRPVSAEGVETDLEFTDLDNFRTKPGILRIRELRTGGLVMRNLAAELAFDSADKAAWSRLTLQLLGGTATAGPFAYYPARRELDATLQVEGLSLAELLALMPGVPAKASGRVEGRLPIHLDEGGLRLGSGTLQLKPGTTGEIRFSPAGPLKLTELRLDLRPPGAPPGCSATLHLAGEPLDTTMKAPVILDRNFNGPLEKLLKLGMNPR